MNKKQIHLSLGVIAALAFTTICPQLFAKTPSSPTFMARTVDVEMKEATRMADHWLYWRGGEIAISLPKGTEYSRGWIDTGNGGHQDLVSAKEGIPVSDAGDVLISFNYVTEKMTKKKHISQKFSSMGELSLEILRNNCSNEEYFDGLLNTTDAELLSRESDAMIFSIPVYREIDLGGRIIKTETKRSDRLIKVMILDNVAVQLSIDCYAFGGDPRPLSKRPIYHAILKVSCK